MADDGSTRTRRWKLHKAGDHSECRRCDAVRGRVTVPSVALLTRKSGEDDAAPDLDPQEALERQARRLGAACEAAPGSSALERELRATLLALRGPAGQADDELTGFLAEFRGA